MDLDKQQVHRYLLIGVLLLYLILALGYGVATPLFEGPDEHHHYFTAETIAKTWRLPSVGTPADGWMRQEAAQPPLYYVLGAALMAPIEIDSAESRAQTQFNPHVMLGDPTNGGNNVNAFVHDSAEKWPWSGHVLAGHLLRILSTLFGLGTLLCIYAAVREIRPKAPGQALIATAFVAFLPQFAFIHATISNDTLITFLSAATLMQLLHLWYKKISPSRLLILGISLGLAILTKTHGTLLFMFALAVLCLLAMRERDWRIVLRAALLVALPAILIGGWLWWRNWNLYGDPTAANQFVALAGGDRNFTLLQAISALRPTWSTFIARFGWSNIPAPNWVYVVWRGIVWLAVIGISIQLIRSNRKPQPTQPTRLLERQWFPIIWLIAWCLLSLAALLAFMMRTPGGQGRLFFPLLLPLASALALGFGGYRWLWLKAGVVGASAVTAIYCLVFVLIPAFAQPALLSEAEIPPDAHRLEIDMGQGFELVAVSAEKKSVKPGDQLHLTLYWRTSSTPSAPPTFEAQLKGRGYAPVGSVSGYHGRGQYPATLWPLNSIVADSFKLRLDSNIVAPTLARLFVRLADAEYVEAGSVKLVPHEWPELAESVSAEIDPHIQLISASLSSTVVRPGDSLLINVEWQTSGPVGQELITFVHLWDPTQQILIAQTDSPPLSGDYPTAFWDSAERFSDQYLITIPLDAPTGTYPVLIGMYDSATIVRRPLFINGQRQSADKIIIGRLEILP